MIKPTKGIKLGQNRPEKDKWIGINRKGIGISARGSLYNPAYTALAAKKREK
jgi:hypothetical protein